MKYGVGNKSHCTYCSSGYAEQNQVGEKGQDDACQSCDKIEKQTFLFAHPYYQCLLASLTVVVYVTVVVHNE